MTLRLAHALARRPLRSRSGYGLWLRGLRGQAQLPQPFRLGRARRRLKLNCLSRFPVGAREFCLAFAFRGHATQRYCQPDRSEIRIPEANHELKTKY